MNITITTTKEEKNFNNVDVLTIGNEKNCTFKVNTDFNFQITLKRTETGKWQVLNTSGTDRVLFRGQPISGAIVIGSLCKLMIADTNEFISIKITDGGTNPKVVPGSLELANRKNAAAVKRVETNKRTLEMIQNEDLNEADIESLYGTGNGVQAKIKLDRKKADIDRRRALITKEIAYKANYLRQKLAQNELLLGILNAFIIIVPLLLTYIVKDVYSIYVDGQNIGARIQLLVVIGLIVTTFILKHGSFLQLQNKVRNRATHSAKLVESLCMLTSGGVFFLTLVFSLEELLINKYTVPQLAAMTLIICVFLNILLGVFSGFTKNTISETGEELDSYESREDFQAVIKDYQHWITLFVNNTGRKKLRDMNDKIFNLQMKGLGEYLLGFGTAPFLAYGVSQTLAECFPEAAAWIRLSDGFKFSPIFLVLASLMICFAFHCFATSFATSKRIMASNVIKQDGFNDFSVHGCIIHGVESSKNLKREAKKWFLIAISVVFIELTMNVSYFVGVMGSDIMGVVISLVAALVPTAILIMETTMLGQTKFEIIIREEMLEKVDKEY